MKTEKLFTIRVRRENNEIEISIPLTDRTSIGLDSEGTGRKALDIVKELVSRINEIK